VVSTTSPHPGHPSANHDSGPLKRLHDAIHHAAHLLPAQGPIGVFVHHNTLHAFQHLPFETAVLEASEIFGTQPYMAEADYRRDLTRGRIQEGDIDAVLAAEPDREILPGDWASGHCAGRC